MAAGVAGKAPLHLSRKPSKVWKRDGCSNEGPGQTRPAPMLLNQPASIPSSSALHDAIDRDDLTGLVELLLPGVEGFFCHRLGYEPLSGSAEDERRGFVSRLSILRTAGLPLAGGGKPRLKIPQKHEDETGFEPKGDEVPFCPCIPDSRDDYEIPTTVSNLYNEHLDLADFKSEDVEDEEMEYENKTWTMEYEDSGIDYRYYASEDETEDEDDDGEAEAYTPDLDCIPATVPIAAGPPSGWMKGKKLGRGAYGEVYQCLNEKTSEDLGMVVKEICLDKKKIRDEAEREVSLLEQISHERIVQYHGHEEVKTEYTETFRIFMECMQGGSLNAYIHEKNGPDGCLSEDEAGRITRQILEGLAFLHSKGIIHRDIKSDNILMDKNGNVKLGDFGTARLLDDPEQSGHMRTFCGTYYQMSPELLKGDYGRKTDIWSLGCTIVEMLTGKTPWSDLEPMQAVFTVGGLFDEDAKPGDFKLGLPHDTSEEARNFINLCLQPKDKRPSAQELLQHPFCHQLVQRNSLRIPTSKTICTTLLSPCVQDLSIS